MGERNSLTNNIQIMVKLSGDINNVNGLNTQCIKKIELS